MGRHFLQYVLLLMVAPEFKTRIGVAHAFSTTSPTACALLDTRNCHKALFREHVQRGRGLFSIPPPLSPLSDNEDYNYDNYTPAEVTKMQDMVVSLSQESNDETRRTRLKLIIEVGLAGPNGGPKRFAVLFDRVLTQVGEQVQREAREKYAARAADSEAGRNGDDNLSADTVLEKDESDEGGNPPEDKPVEKTPEELKLWALVDMMIQSKTMIKKHNF